MAPLESNNKIIVVSLRSLFWSKVKYSQCNEVHCTSLVISSECYLHG